MTDVYLCLYFVFFFPRKKRNFISSRGDTKLHSVGAEAQLRQDHRSAEKITKTIILHEYSRS